MVKPQIPIVDEHDRVITYKERGTLAPSDIYRVSALWLTDERSRVLMARRAFHKTNDPGIWGPAVAGTLERRETYEDNIMREAHEEIGISVHPVPHKKLLINGKKTFFCQWYTATVPSTTHFRINKDEVSEIKWFTPEELRKELKKKPKQFLQSSEHWLMFL